MRVAVESAMRRRDAAIEAMLEEGLDRLTCWVGPFRPRSWPLQLCWLEDGVETRLLVCDDVVVSGVRIELGVKP